MSKALPRKPHADSLRAQARQLLREHQSGQAEALERIRAHSSGSPSAEFTLQSSQRVLAREYGFKCWADLMEAVQVLRRADSDLLPAVDAALQGGQPLHVLVRSHTVAEIVGMIEAHCGREPLTLGEVGEERRISTSLSRLTEASLVVGAAHELGFLVMYERLGKPEGPWAFDDLLAKVHAFVNMPLLDDTSPLIISGWDEERGEARDLISMHLPEVYALYGSMADHRF